MLQEPRERVIADETQERERTALLEGCLQGARGNWETCWILGAGSKVKKEDGAVLEKLLGVALVSVGRVGTGWGHTARYPPQNWRGALRRAGASAEAQLTRYL